MGRSTDEIIKAGMARLFALQAARDLAVKPGVTPETALDCLCHLVNGPCGAAWAEALDRYSEETRA